MTELDPRDVRNDANQETTRLLGTPEADWTVTELWERVLTRAKKTAVLAGTEFGERSLRMTQAGFRDAVVSWVES